MKNYRILLITVLMAGWTNGVLNAQHVKDYLINRLALTYDIDVDTITVCDVYSIDGAFRSFQTEGNSIDTLRGVRSIKYITPATEDFPHKQCDLMIVVESSKQQKKREKRKLLKTIRGDLNSNQEIQENDRQCQSCKAISINNKFYSPYEGREKINAMKLGQIEYITVYDRPLNKALFGEEGGKNGLIVVKMR